MARQRRVALQLLLLKHIVHTKTASTHRSTAHAKGMIDSEQLNKLCMHVIILYIYHF